MCIPNTPTSITNNSPRVPSLGASRQTSSNRTRWVVNSHSPILPIGAAHQFDFNQSAAQAGRVGVETGQHFVDLLLAILAIRRELFDDVLEQRLKLLLLRRYLF